MNKQTNKQTNKATGRKEQTKVVLATHLTSSRLVPFSYTTPACTVLVMTNEDKSDEDDAAYGVMDIFSRYLQLVQARLVLWGKR